MVDRLSAAEILKNVGENATLSNRGLGGLGGLKCLVCNLSAAEILKNVGENSTLSIRVFFFFPGGGRMHIDCTHLFKLVFN